VRGISNAGTGDSVACLDVIHSGFDYDAGCAVAELFEAVEPVLDFLVASKQTFAVDIVQHLPDQVRPQAGLVNHGSLRRFHRCPFGARADQREHIADEYAARPELGRGQLIDTDLASFLVLDDLKQVVRPFESASVWGLLASHYHSESTPNVGMVTDWNREVTLGDRNTPQPSREKCHAKIRK
jgi:hypothetical protein